MRNANVLPVTRLNGEEGESMSYMGVGYSGYEYKTCPLCGQGMWNGVCENPDCEYHWYLKEDDGEEEND